MSAFHIVAFKLTSLSHISNLTKAFLDLEADCVKPDGSKLFKSVKGGKQCSTEDIHQDMQVVFVVEFETDADLQYYLWKCPAHEAFKQKLAPGSDLQKAGVIALDFIDGHYHA